MNSKTGFTMPGNRPGTFVDLLRWRADNQPDKKVFTFLTDGEAEEGIFTFSDLDRQARSIGAALQGMNLQGQRAVMICPPGLDYVALFFGCLYGGVIPVPAYPPDPNNLARTLPRVLSIIKDAQASIILANRVILAAAKGLAAIAPDLAALRWLDVESLREGPGASWQETHPEPGSLAYLQYTSGSTLSPRGVMISHDNLLRNALVIGREFKMQPEETSVIWLPPYHNMGLIAGLLSHVAMGAPCMVMSPLAFLQSPYRWLKAISDYRATRSGGPNFAFDLAVQRVTAEQRATLDLSCWTLCFCGSEAVRADTINRFVGAFGSCGFHRSAFIPAYGLAEATLLVSGGLREEPPLVLNVDRAGLESNRLIPVAAGTPGSQTYVGNGKPFADQDVRIVDPATHAPGGKDAVGEIWVKGPCIAGGYWQRPAETIETFQAQLADGSGPYMRTGDLGFLYQGELFIAGRVKDMIVIHGKNYYPQDIEATIDLNVKGLPPGSNAAFAVEIEGEERLGIVQEVDPQAGLDPDEVIRAIRRAVASEFSLKAELVALIARGSIPRTASNKIQRFACRDDYQSGSLNAIKISTLAEPAGQPAKQPDSASEENIFKKMFLSLPPEMRRQILMDQLGKEIAAELKVPASELHPDEPLTGFGLDSIGSVEIANKVAAILGVDIPIATLLQGATLNQLADLIVSGMGGGQPVSSVPATVPVLETAKVYPLSYGQRAIWFTKSMEPDNVAYNLVYPFRMNPDVHPRAIQEAFRLMVRRHPALRTTFAEREGEPVQVVHDYLEPEFLLEDASTWTIQDLRARMAAEVFRPFDIDKGPLIRMMIFMNSPEGNILEFAAYHIITDMWSLAILLGELGPFYEAVLNGAEPNLRPIKDAYTDYVGWEQQMVNGPEGEQHWAFWKEALAGAISSLDLPTDRPRPAVPTGKGGARNVRLDPGLAGRLKAFAESHDTSAYITMLAAFNVLLNRYTGQTDILVGFPKFNRDRRTARMMGYFINPVVLRSNLSGDPLFTDYLAQIGKATREAFAHDAYPFPLLVEKLRPVRDRAISPLFQVIFSWQKTTRMVDSSSMTAIALGEEGKRYTFGPLTLETMALEERCSPSDLALLMAEAGDDLGLTIEYNSDIFDSGTIERMLSNLLTLVEAIVTQPDQPISTLPLLSEDEKNKLLRDWNETARMDWRPECLHQVFEQHAALHPEATALVSDGKTLTYGDLDRRANQLAGALQRLGVGPEIIVGICAERSADLIVGLLGTLKAGGIYLPLDPEYPQDRLAYMILDSRMPIVLTQEKLLPRLPTLDRAIICLDKDWPAVADESPEPLSLAVSQANNAYIIYTSGTTGKPKGVLVPHGSAANHCIDLSKYYGHHPGDRILQFASPNFDASLEQIFTCFAAGAALVLRDAEVWPPADFSRMIHELSLTVVNIPPVYWHQWVVEDLVSKEPVANPQLRLVIIGGDVLLSETLNMWYRTPMASARLLNAYGPTETTITSAIYEVPGAENGRTLWRVPIGRPTAHRAFYILDECGQPVPIGVPGELHIGGPCLASGYLNHADLTAARFVPDPFSREPQACMYRTGDLARYLPDGNIEFLGRVDRQVKLRGFRIELEEIESVLQQHPAVGEVTVTVQQGTGSDSQLVGYIVTKGGATAPMEELRAFLRKQVPDYMVPSAFVFLDALPLLPTGKIDRSALPAPKEMEVAQAAGYAAPTNEMEAELASLWASVLKVERVGIHDNFFDLGGHSLLAAQLVSRIRNTYHIELPLRQLFEAPTVATLSKLVMEEMAKQAGPDDDLLAEVENLSEEEVRRLLNEQ